VSGAPGRAARDWLRRNEDLERGWYAGAVGWMDLEGQGELAVALRSALLCGGEARVFAGAGVVVDSDPLAELRETRLKLGAALGALQGADR
jgi:isochorismate synthase EntC